MKRKEKKAKWNGKGGAANGKSRIHTKTSHALSKSLVSLRKYFAAKVKERRIVMDTSY